MEALKAFSPGAVTNSTADPTVVPNLAATTLTVSNTTVPSAKSAITEDLSETKSAATGPASQLPTSSHQPVDKTAASETTTTSSTQNPDIEPSRDAPTVTGGSKSAPTGASSLAEGDKTSPHPKGTSATSSGAAQTDSAAGSVTKSSDGDKNGAGTGGEAGDKAGDKQ
jgi:hypothetical protein